MWQCLVYNMRVRESPNEGLDRKRDGSNEDWNPGWAIREAHIPWYDVVECLVWLWSCSWLPAEWDDRVTEVWEEREREREERWASHRRQRTLRGARRRKRGFGSCTAVPSKTLLTGQYTATSSTTTFVSTPFPDLSHRWNFVNFSNSFFFTYFQASNLRERFEQNRHVVRSSLSPLLPMPSVHLALTVNCLCKFKISILNQHFLC